MTTITFDELQQRFIRHLADCFQKGRINMTRQLMCDELSLSEEMYESLIRMADSLGLIENISSTDGYFATWFQPTFKAVSVSQQIAAAEKEQKQQDFVAQIHNRIKQNPRYAILIIIFIFLAFIAPIYSMVTDLLERVGCLSVPK